MAQSVRADADHEGTSSPKDRVRSRFIPYPPIGDSLEHVPINVRPDVHYYISRMAFMPNAIKLYLHNPGVVGRAR